MYFKKVFVLITIMIALVLMNGCDLEEKTSIDSIEEAPTTREPGDAQIILWEHTNYTGASRVMKSTDKNFSDNWIIWPALSWNDQVSSIEVINGASATVYEHKNGDGNSLRITSSIPNLKKETKNLSGSRTWNDRISSIYF
ncbi:MAG: peptidase inhibitor family I36 protein [Spirochaetales bacterium]|nr:peptidase inhibitor family I36 protein [Spirochaetales bacterium]